MGRGIAYTREVRNKVIARKKRLSRELYGFDWCKHDGQYSKSKIHCSCRMCTFSKYYGLRTLKDMKEETYFKNSLNEHYSEEN